MAEELRNSFNRYLKYLANSLDIPENAADKAVSRYQAVGMWLARKESPVADLNPDIYSQGSFRLGTVTKPISDAEEYDVDLVCELKYSKNQITQKRLKHLIGNEIKAYATSNNFLSPVEERKRCWTLNYADGAQFHLDILPAITDGESFRALLKSNGLMDDRSGDAIAVTDITHPKYNVISWDWYRSNPKGYSEWFKDRSIVSVVADKAYLANMRKSNIENIPDFEIKKPLQQAVQLLKRHRDIMFVNDKKNKPISIIISTLAAHAYNNGPDLFDTIIGIANGMARYITSRGDGLWVANPVNPMENFAEKWHQHPEKGQAFNRWIIQLQTDLNTALQAKNLQEFADLVKPKLGERAANEALKHFPNSGIIRVGTTIAQGSIVSNQIDVSHRQKPIWPVQSLYPVNISGRIKINDQWQPFNSNCQPLPKDCRLQFSAKTGVPHPFDVFWQVVNTGEEAKRAEGLRGKIFPSDSAGAGGLFQKESTSYTGMHWIECFIVKDGVCLGRSGEFIVNIK